MRGALGILIYLILAVVSSLIRQAAEQKRRKARIPLGEAQAPYDAEDLVQEAPPIQVWEPLRGDVQESVLVAEVDDEEQAEGTRPAAQALDEPVGRWDRVPRISRIAEAVIMSEIIREPRALRRWPSR
jgi:hypothetical protein